MAYNPIVDKKYSNTAKGRFRKYKYDLSVRGQLRTKRNNLEKKRKLIESRLKQLRGN